MFSQIELYINVFLFINKDELLSLRKISKKYKKMVKLYGLYYFNQLQIYTHKCFFHENIKINVRNVNDMECMKCVMGFAVLLCYENTEPLFFIGKIIDNESILTNYINALLDLEKMDFIEKIYNIKKLNFSLINKNRGCFISDKLFGFISRYMSLDNIGKIHDIKSYKWTFEFATNIFDNINLSMDATFNRFNFCFNDSNRLLQCSNDILDVKKNLIKSIDNAYILLKIIK